MRQETMHQKKVMDIFTKAYIASYPDNKVVEGVIVRAVFELQDGSIIEEYAMDEKKALKLLAKHLFPVKLPQERMFNG